MDVYTHDCLSDPSRDWFHGQLARVEAIYALKQSEGDCFLVRESKGNFVLSLSHCGEIYHIKIKYGPGGYNLDMSKVSFGELHQLISHYSDSPVKIGGKSKGTLKVACKKVSSLPTTTPG